MPALDAPAKNPGEYKASMIAFGGSARQTAPHERFDRDHLMSQARNFPALGAQPTTPMAQVIDEAAASFATGRGLAALVIIGDGRADNPTAAVDATRRLVAGYKDGVCIHTVHTGDSAEGRALLTQLAGLSTQGCGSARQASSIRDAAALEDIERRIFLGDAPLPAVAAAAQPDSCEGRVVLRGVTFQLDRAVLLPESKPVLDLAAEQLRGCANRKIVVEGHTCSLGSDPYNQGLSSRRAEAVRQYLVDHGVSPAQLKTRGLGEASPTASNATEDGRAQNRRVELVPEN